ncbi:MAG: ABC transporter substrate-binding protein [Alphaproteobacteria bacterium]|nr:ABC transporter substrate-binding protein [Alphaproteobacteria bacterium]
MRLILSLCVALAGFTAAHAQSSGNLSPDKPAAEKLVIGVMGDQSGVVSDVGGKGSVLAARMAVADFGGKALGKPIELLVADHQNKPDVASSIARRWFDGEGVEAIVDLPHTGVVLGLQGIARDKQKTLLVSGAASVEITGRSCSPFTTHWTDDTYALARATAKAVTKGEGETWYFLTADYSFGHDLERDASATIRELGGKVLGSARHPLSTQDFSSFLLQAQATKAKIIGLASAGADTVNAIKQAKEYGLEANGQRLAALHAFVTDVHSLGLPTAQGLIITTGFYWDSTEGTRAWARRFLAEHGRMPTREQAGVYVSLLHYLKAVQAAGTADAAAVNAAMRKLPVDRFGEAAAVRADGRVIYDTGVYQVKTPGESSEPWDYYRRIATVPGTEAFRPLAAGGCPFAQQASQ